MPHAVKVHIRKCPDCGRDEWWMAPKSAAGRHLQVFPPIRPPSRASSSWKWGLMAVSWIVAHDLFSGEIDKPIDPDTARCTNCGREIRFAQA